MITHLKNYVKSHPITIGSTLGTIAIFAAVGLIVSLVSRLGFNADQANAIIAENKAPKTLELVGTLSLAILLSRSIFHGPSGVPNSAARKWLIVGLPSTVVSIAAGFTGVTLGSFLGFLSCDANFTNHATSQGWVDLTYAVTMLVFSYCLALVLTIDKNTAPVYADRWFQLGYRVICFILMVILLGRSGLTLLLLSRGSAA